MSPDSIKNCYLQTISSQITLVQKLELVLSHLKGLICRKTQPTNQHHYSVVVDSRDLLVNHHILVRCSRRAK